MPQIQPLLEDKADYGSPFDVRLFHCLAVIGQNSVLFFFSICLLQLAFSRHRKSLINKGQRLIEIHLEITEYLTEDYKKKFHRPGERETGVSRVKLSYIRHLPNFIKVRRNCCSKVRNFRLQHLYNPVCIRVTCKGENNSGIFSVFIGQLFSTGIANYE